jgi:hypothetical protein
MKATFFRIPEEFGQWLEQSYATVETGPVLAAAGGQHLERRQHPAEEESRQLARDQRQAGRDAVEEARGGFGPQAQTGAVHQGKIVAMSGGRVIQRWGSRAPAGEVP